MLLATSSLERLMTLEEGVSAYVLEPSQFGYGIKARNIPYSAWLELGHYTKSYTEWVAGEEYWVEQADELERRRAQVQSVISQIQPVSQC